MDYVKHYDDHYKQMGEAGAGQLVWEPQFEIWKQAGYKNQSILDYGCGVGIMLETGVKDYVGVDISQEAVKLAQKRYPNADFRFFEMGKCPSFGKKVCVAQSVFTHTPKAHVDKCLQDVKRNFKDFAIIDILIGEDNPLDEHVRYFTGPEWEDCLWRAELAGERIGEHVFTGFNHIYYRITHA